MYPNGTSPGAGFSRDPGKVSLAYSVESTWRNRAEFVTGREAIVQFLTRKWAEELDYRLIKELWAFHENRIAVRFAYEWDDESGNWFRSYGNENGEFNADGLMQKRYASINDLPIRESERKYHWPLGRRPDDRARFREMPPAPSLRCARVAAGATPYRRAHRSLFAAAELKLTADQLKTLTEASAYEA